MQSEPEKLNETSTQWPVTGQPSRLVNTKPKADVVIVSAYGRGNWLAVELAERGWQVTLADVGDSLEPSETEDTEGPFGWFESSELLPSQMPNAKRAFGGEIEISDLSKVESGFVLWLKGGPVEFTGPLFAFQFAKLKMAGEVGSYLKNLPRVLSSERTLQKLERQISKMEYHETWLAHFAHQLASPFISENHLAFGSSRALDVFAPFWIRQVTRESLDRGLRFCAAKGVNVRPRASIRDVRLSGRLVDAIEIADDRAGVELARSFVWTLSGLETERFPESVAKALFPRGKVSPSWYWTRYEIRFAENLQPSDSDQLPTHIVAIEDPYLPWTHTNVIVLRKRRETNAFDAWVRLPIRAAGEQSYRREIGLKIEAILQARFPVFAPKVAESGAHVQEIDPIRIPVFEFDQLKRFAPTPAANLLWAGPERWESLDSTGRLCQHVDVLNRLEKLKAQWTAAEAKLAARGKS